MRKMLVMPFRNFFFINFTCLRLADCLCLFCKELLPIVLNFFLVARTRVGKKNQQLFNSCNFPVNELQIIWPSLFLNE